MFYPKVDHSFITAFTIICKGIQENNDYLSSKSCPYPSGLKKALSNLEVKDVSEVVVPVAVSLTDEELLTHAEQLLLEFDEVRGQFDEDTGTSERVSYLRAKTSLIEKIIEQREMIHAAINAEKFKKIVLDILDDTLTDEQRTLFLERLKKSL